MSSEKNHLSSGSLQNLPAQGKSLKKIYLSFFTVPRSEFLGSTVSGKSSHFGKIIAGRIRNSLV